MIKLEADYKKLWCKNFAEHILEKTGKGNAMQWSNTRRQELAKFGGKVSRMKGVTSFVFVRDADAAAFLLRWS